MFISETYRRNVGYFVADEWDNESQRWYRAPQGTIFFVAEMLEHGYGSLVRYAVTARHIVETVNSDRKRFGDTFLRVNPHAGEASDWPVSYGDWICHPTSDVAVCELNLPPQPYFDIWAVPILRQFGVLELGQDVFCVGMFAEIPGHPRVEAIVRTGRIALPKTTLPIVINAATKEESEITGSLLEVHSWGGESGSPVFAYLEKNKINAPSVSRFMAQSEAALKEMRIVPEVDPTLIGLLQGHYPLRATVDKGTVSTGTVELNSGIAVMVSFADIRATLYDKRLMKDREEKDKAAERQYRKKATPKPDMVSRARKADSSESFTQADFEAALKKVARKIEPEK
jgi:hypothetical protein